MRKRMLAVLLSIVMVLGMLPVTASAGAAGTQETDVRGFATVDELLAGHDNEGVAYYEDVRYNIAINYGSSEDGKSYSTPVWKVFGDDGTGRNAVTLMASNEYAAGGGTTSFNTEDHVASLSTDSYEEYGVKQVSRSTDDPSPKDAIWSFQRKPAASAWGTSAVRDRLKNQYQNMFNTHEKAEILSNTIYTDVISPLEQQDSDTTTYYTYSEIYSTTDYLYLPYLDRETGEMYVSANSASDVTSGKKVTAEEWDSSAGPYVTYSPHTMIMRGMHPGILWRNIWWGILEGGHELVGPGYDKGISVINNQFADSTWSYPQGYGDFDSNSQGYALPCFSLDTSDINFASVFYPAGEENMHDNGKLQDSSVWSQYHLRFEGDLGTATISPDKKSVKIEDLSPISDFDVDAGVPIQCPIYLVVQYSNSWQHDPYAYAIEVKEGDEITAADLTGSDLTYSVDSFDNCEVWLESTVPSRNITYATMAEQDTRLVLTQSQDTLSALQHQSDLPEPVTFTLTNYQDSPQEITWFDVLFEGADVQYNVSTTSDEMIGTVLQPDESKTFTVGFADTDTVVDENITINIDSRLADSPDATPTNVSATLNCKVISVGVPSIISVSQDKYDALANEDVTYEIFVPETQSIGRVTAVVGDGISHLTQSELEEGTDYTISAKNGDITFVLKRDWIGKTNWKEETRSDDGGYISLWFYEDGEENSLLFHSLNIREIYGVSVSTYMVDDNTQNSGGEIYRDDQKVTEPFYVSEDIPFTVKAVPDSGNAFDHFDISYFDNEERSNPLTLTLNKGNMGFSDNTSIEAYFTSSGQEETPEVIFNATGDSWGRLTNFELGMKYSVDGGKTWIDIPYAGEEIYGVSAENDIQVYMPGNGTSTTDSGIQTIDVTQAEAPTGIGSTDCTTADQNDGKITGVDETMEYKLSTDTVWKEITGTEVTGLSNGTYQVRVKANGTVLPSPAAEVVIDKHTCTAIGAWQHDDYHHWKECDVCGARVDEGAHSGGTATCTEKAVCEVCGASYGELGEHTWGEPVYTWSEDGKTCTATRTCKNDLSYTETATGTITSEQTKAPTETEPGETTYTAAFEESWATAQTKVIADIPATGSEWNAPEYEWSEDGSSCIATRTHKTDTDRVEKAEATITSEVTKDPTCTEKGETTYTATFSESWATTQSKTVENIQATGHSWGEPVYTWSENGKTCTATRTCENNPIHTETATGTIKSEQTKAPTETEPGETTYTAAFEESWATTQTKVIADIPATGSEWNAPKYEWSEDGSSCIATRTHKTEAGREETATATITHKVTKNPTCTEKGETTYTATFDVDWAEKQEKVIANIPATGHKYENGKCTVCGAIDGSFQPVIIAGANGTWKKGSEGGLSFTSNAAFAHFQKVQVDGKDLDASSYTVEEGSTIVTLKPEYLETLSIGKHTFSIVSETGTASTEFNVTAAQTGGGGSSGGGNSGSSGSTTETTQNPDGSTTTTVTRPDGSTTETTEKPDGSQEVVSTDKDGTVTTTTTDPEGNKTEIVEKTDGSSQTTVTNEDGSSSVTVSGQDGRSETQVKLPDTVTDNAEEKGEAVKLPMPAIPVASDSETASTVAVDLPAGKSAKVEIPVENPAAGTVAILVKEDGSEEIIKTSVAGESGVFVTLQDGDKVKIVDNSKDYADVSDSYWGTEAVDFVSSREMMNGVGNDSFAPDSNLTRGMIAQVLYNLEDAPEAGSDVFGDVEAGQWYADAVNWAAANDIVSGYDDSTFGPQNDITREQMAQILYNYAVFKGYDVSAQGDLSAFSDGTATSDWALPAMKWAVGSGLLQGYAGRLNPDGTATRVEVAQIFMNFCENIVMK